MPRAQHRAGPTLSPATAKALIETFAQDVTSCSSESPDSLYSNGSPTFPEHPAFEYEAHEADMQDAEPYEVLDDEVGGAEGDSGSWASPAWGRWPQNSRGFNSPGWSPSPRGSIISLSLSPRGSSSTQGRRSSGFSGKGKQRAEGERRESNPALLGFDLANQRRRSSTRSLSVSGHSSRRRSSAYSYGSGIDPLEDNRLRNIASLELLRRRFSEVVQVDYDSEAEDGDEADDRSESDLHAVARARAAFSQWSPESDESDEESEVHTASYQPSPDFRSPSVPVILSNFPLASVAREQQFETPSDISIAASPVPLSAPRFAQQIHQGISTPPAPDLPSAILRGRNRPAVQRAATAWEMPASITSTASSGVPPGAVLPRPGLGRSVSNPWFSAASRAREAASVLEKRAAGSFPLARAAPLGVSPLRASLRRQSVVSDGEASRRGSAADRRPSTASSFRHRQSIVSDTEEARRASFAERRLSLVKETALRRASRDSREGDKRRSSRSTSVTGVGSRKSSTANSFRKDSDADSLRRSSKDSRKSSVVSVGEYGYLAPQIVIDAPLPTPPIATVAKMPSLPRLRNNAPASIVLPAYAFPPLGQFSASSPNTASADTPLFTPRFNPTESFFGKATHSPTTPTASIRLPSASSSSGSSNGHTDSGRTPRCSPKVSVMSRGRPVTSSPEHHSFPFRQMPSPKSSPVLGQETSPEMPLEGDTSPRSLTTRKVTPNRKPAPKMSIEELQMEAMRDDQLRLQHEPEMIQKMERRGAASGATASPLAAFEQAILTGSAGHRRTVSIEAMTAAALASQQLRQHDDDGRPTFRRQATLPAELGRAPGEPLYQRHSIRPRARGMSVSQTSPSVPGPTHEKAKSKLGLLSSPSAKHKAEHKLNKRSSVTFADQTTSSQPAPSSPKSISTGFPFQRPGMDRTSSFTRFFHSRSKSSTATLSAVSGSKSGSASSSSSSSSSGSLKSALRPVSMDSSVLPSVAGTSAHSQRFSPLSPAKYSLGLGSPRR